MQADRGSSALYLEHLAYKTAVKEEEGENLLALNYLSPDKTYITSAHSPLARSSHMAESKLQGTL